MRLSCFSIMNWKHKAAGKSKHMFMAVNQTATSKLWIFLSNMIKPRRKSFTLGTVETITLFFVVKNTSSPQGALLFGPFHSFFYSDPLMPLWGQNKFRNIVNLFVPSARLAGFKRLNLIIKKSLLTKTRRFNGCCGKQQVLIQRITLFLRHFGKHRARKSFTV